MNSKYMIHKRTKNGLMTCKNADNNVPTSLSFVC